MKPMKLALAALAAAALGAAAPATAATVVASASSSPFRLDTREGPFESDGTETITYSSRWHGTADSTVTIWQNGAPIADAQRLDGEGDYVWRVVANGTYELVHETTPFALGDGEDGYESEKATFIVKGFYPEPSATLRWKYAKNANGWFCAQVALTWHPGYAAGITNMRLLFADRYDAAERLSAYLVDPATVVDPLGATETYRDIEYRVARIDLDAFSNLGEGDRAVFGVSDETLAGKLDSVPKSERKICLRVPNRQLQTVEFLDNKIAWLAWDEGQEHRFLPLVGSWASAETEAEQPGPQPDASFGAPLPRPASLDEANEAKSFGLPLAAVATAEVTCRIASMGFGADGSVEGTFEIAAEDAGRVVAESGELAGNVNLTVLGAESLGGAFEPLDPAACGVELLSRKPPYAFRVAAPGKNAFFKIRLEAEDVLE